MLRAGQPRWSSSSVQCQGREAGSPMSETDEDIGPRIFAIPSGDTATVRRLIDTRPRTSSAGSGTAVRAGTRTGDREIGLLLVEPFGKVTSDKSPWVKVQSPDG